MVVAEFDGSFVRCQNNWMESSARLSTDCFRQSGWSAYLRADSLDCVALLSPPRAKHALSVAGYVLFIASTASLFELFGLRGRHHRHVRFGVLLICSAASAREFYAVIRFGLMIAKLSFFSSTGWRCGKFENSSERDSRTASNRQKNDDRKKAEDQKLAEKTGRNADYFNPANAPAANREKKTGPEKTPSVLERLKNRRRKRTGKRIGRTFVAAEEIETPNCQEPEEAFPTISF